MSIVFQMPLLDRQMPALSTLEPDSQHESEHGEVFTREWVVDLVLDAVGYRPELDLAESVVVEPSCGHGAFLLPIVSRLVQSCALHGRAIHECTGAIRAFDLLERNADVAREAIRLMLIAHGESPETSAALPASWIASEDFILGRHDIAAADFVVGNPPYVRLEGMSPKLSDAYRGECPTMRGRADLYIGFFEKGLSLLKPGGRLGFICADRWMRNQYGARLRELVVTKYAMDAVIVMHDVDAFEGTVSAYPAITILRNGAQNGARVIDTSAAFDEISSKAALDWIQGPGNSMRDKDFTAVKLPAWFGDSSHWPSGSPQELELLADLERRFSPLQDSLTGTRVGIGVATGCDEIYIGENFPDIEFDRLLPLLTAADIAGGQPDWSGKRLVNPWADHGLVDLADFPGLAAYCERHADRLRARHVARKRPATWYRTIDRVTPGLRTRPKLLFPDMKAAAHPVLDPGHFYPHHNLYYIVSDSWDLEVLGGLLLSDVANLFVGAYCVKMRGGTYRFQAQYLRKIRVPVQDLICELDREALRAAFRSRDRSLATEVASKVYGITSRCLRKTVSASRESCISSVQT